MDWTAENVVIASFLFPLISITVVGNSLTLIAWFTHEKVRTASNFLLVSLAIPDLVIGGLSIPLSTSQLLTHNWVFGIVTCQVYITLSIIMSFVSSGHLVLIALDRYKVLTYGIVYIQHQSIKSNALAVSLLYLIGLCIGSPYIFDWNTTGEYISNPEHESASCFFKETSAFILYLIAFIRFLPGVMMIALYLQIFKALKLRLRKHATHNCSSGDSNGTNVPLSTIEVSREISESNNPNQEDKKAQNSETSGKSILNISQRERRAARILGILIGCFVICWLPYVTVSLLKAVFDVNTPRLIYLASLVLGWINSAVNPFVYAIHNKEFNQAFKNFGRAIFQCFSKRS